jgi:capsular exopolysaccharide synthesis family protein
LPNGSEPEGIQRPAAQAAPPGYGGPGYAGPPRDEDQIDLRAYWRMVVRRRWVILSVFAAAVLATAVWTLRQTKIYAATTTLIIELSAPRVLDKEQVQEVVESGTGGYWYSKEYYETQYKVITSRAVAQRVAEKLHLATDRRFLGFEDLKGEAEAIARLAGVDAAAVLQERVKVLPVKDSRVVRIQVEDRDPTWAATLANAVAEAYIAENLSVRSTSTQNASEWLEEQLADLEVKLARSAEELFAFKQANDIVATSWEDRQSMVSQRLTAINDALTKARVRRAELEARNDAIEALGRAAAEGTGAAEALAPVASSPAIQQLKVRHAEARAECADLRVKYLEGHPSLEACERKLALAEQALRKEIRTQLQSARNEYREVVKTEKNLVALLNETKSDAFGLNQHERRYLELKRTHDNNQRLYELLLRRLKDTGVTGMLQVSNVRILDRAQPSLAPVRPKVRQMLTLAGMIGLFVGVGLALLVEMLDTSITTQAHVEERLGLTFLGVLPRIGPGRTEGASRQFMVRQQPQSAVAECLRSIRANLLFMSPDRPLKRILVTSAGPEEGKTTTASLLAQIMADGGSRVLLVDADMRRPRIHRIFDTSAGEGLSSLILGEGKIDGAVKATEVPNLWVLPCGPVPPNPAELLHAEAFRTLVEELARRFDRVILDSPPVGAVSDPVVISTAVDGTLLVLKAGRTSRDHARRAVRALTDVNARVFGAVLNDLDLKDERYGRYYHYQRYGYPVRDGGETAAS